MPQVYAAGSQREPIWKEESWPIESEGMQGYNPADSET